MIVQKKRKENCVKGFQKRITVFSVPFPKKEGSNKETKGYNCDKANSQYLLYKGVTGCGTKLVDEIITEIALFRRDFHLNCYENSWKSILNFSSVLYNTLSKRQRLVNSEVKMKILLTIGI